MSWAIGHNISLVSDQPFEVIDGSLRCRQALDDERPDKSIQIGRILSFCKLHIYPAKEPFGIACIKECLLSVLSRPLQLVKLICRLPNQIRDFEFVERPPTFVHSPKLTHRPVTLFPIAQHVLTCRAQLTIRIEHLDSEAPRKVIFNAPLPACIGLTRHFYIALLPRRYSSCSEYRHYRPNSLDPCGPLGTGHA